MAAASHTGYEALECQRASLNSDMLEAEHASQILKISTKEAGRGRTWYSKEGVSR